MPIRPIDMQGLAPGALEGERRGQIENRQVTVNEMTQAGLVGRTSARETERVPAASESSTSRRVEEREAREQKSKKGRSKAGKSASISASSSKKKDKPIPVPFKGSRVDVKA
jgi:hypothetical protein